jgi:F-type H+-transporting ATPase subunit b
MEINWFTYFAQIVNFLILIALLQKFLYKPITRAMTQRKLQIKATIDEANEKRIAAEEELEKYRQQNLKLQEEKQIFLLKVREEAAIEREKLMDKIASEVEISKAKWYQDIAQEQEEFLLNVRRRTLEEIYRVLGLSLRDLAHVELEKQMVNVFLENLQQEKDKLQRISSDTTITVGSAFVLSDEQQNLITQTIKEYSTKNNQVIFKINSALICGISLTFNGQEIVWSIANYLQNLSDSLTIAINK